VVVQIKNFLQCGSDFNTEGQLDRREMLPTWWRLWPSETKAAVMSLVFSAEESGAGWCGDLVEQILEEYSVEITELQNLRVCCTVEREVGASLSAPEPPVDPATIATVPSITEGLSLYELQPAGLTGVALFEHMCRFRLLHNPETAAKTSAHVGEIDVTAVQKSIIQPTDRDLAINTLLRESGGEGGQRKLPQRRLNTLGEINNQCVVSNDPARLKKMRLMLQLAKSIDDAKAAEKAKKAQDKHTVRGSVHISSAERALSHGIECFLTTCYVAVLYFVMQKLTEVKARAPAAVAKYIAAGKDASKLTIRELLSIGYVHLHMQLSSKKKAAVVAEFKDAAALKQWDPTTVTANTPAPTAASPTAVEVEAQAAESPASVSTPMLTAGLLQLNW